MTRAEILKISKPILFNTEMVQAILDNLKTVTRRVVKPQPVMYGFLETCFDWSNVKAPYSPGDILYVRETFCGWNLPIFGMKYCYKATDPNGNRAPTGQDPDDEWEVRPWRPSIHMPKEAARLFLRVTDVRVERLQDIFDDPPGSENQIVKEGCKYGCDFIAVWDRTIKPADRALYGWDANPWVWVIEFEKMEAEK